MKTHPASLRTARLLLRPWRDADLPAFAAMNADPEVRRWFPGTLTREQSDASAARFQEHIATHGFGFWAVEAPGTAPFVGFVGLQHVAFAAPFNPAVEAGWRLAREHWERGYATEAARAALAYGFGPLGLIEIVAFTVPGNLASRRVMERIGMQHDPEGDFDHPTYQRASRFGAVCSTAPDGTTQFLISRTRKSGNPLLWRAPASYCLRHDDKDHLPLRLIGDTSRAFGKTAASVTMPGHGSSRCQPTQ